VRELSLHILDALENSVEAGATRVELRIDENLKNDILKIVIKDDGRGMSEEFVRQVLNPFVTTRKTRHVGLGLPLFAAAARRCNGDLQLQSRLGVGTTVTATFQHSHIDRAPLGDIAGALIAIILSDRPVQVYYRHRVNRRTFELDTAVVQQELEPVPLSHPAVREWLQSTLTEGVTRVRQPALDWAGPGSTSGQRSGLEAR
jgi:anti-sigma regulatory factor (Ser/Thr protein kinase)